MTNRRLLAIRVALAAGAGLALGLAAPCEAAVFRCASGGRVSYQDWPCPPGSRELVVNTQTRPVAGSVRRDAAAASSTRTGEPGARSWREVVSHVRVGMTREEVEALDVRMRNGRQRTLEANGRRHEWRYVSDDCVLHLVDDIVVAIFR
jgi:Domain of unknown function (DUF4124)